jgi:hypothetical protein
MRSRFTKVFPASIHDDDDGVRRAKCLYELVEIRSIVGHKRHGDLPRIAGPASRFGTSLRAGHRRHDGRARRSRSAVGASQAANTRKAIQHARRARVLAAVTDQVTLASDRRNRKTRGSKKTLHRKGPYRWRVKCAMKVAQKLVRRRWAWSSAGLRWRSS